MEHIFPPNSFQNVQLRNNLCLQLFCSNNSHWHLLWEFVPNVSQNPNTTCFSGRMERAELHSTREEGKKEPVRCVQQILDGLQTDQQ